MPIFLKLFVRYLIPVIPHVLQIRVAGQLFNTKPGLDGLYVRHPVRLFRMRPFSTHVTAQRLEPRQGAHVYGHRRVRGRLLDDVHAIRRTILQASPD